MRAHFRNVSTGQDTTISIRGGILGQDADLAVGEDGEGPLVGQIRRKLFSKSEWGGQQTVGRPRLVWDLCIVIDRFSIVSSHRRSWRGFGALRSHLHLL